MPILTTTESAGKRRLLSWLIVLMAVVLALVTTFVWSWFRPIVIRFNKGGVLIGFSPGDSAATGFHDYNFGAFRVSGLVVRLPDDSGAYIVTYHW